MFSFWIEIFESDSGKMVFSYPFDSDSLGDLQVVRDFLIEMRHCLVFQLDLDFDMTIYPIREGKKDEK